MVAMTRKGGGRESGGGKRDRTGATLPAKGNNSAAKHVALCPDCYYPHPDYASVIPISAGTGIGPQRPYRTHSYVLHDRIRALEAELRTIDITRRSKEHVKTAANPVARPLLSDRIRKWADKKACQCIPNGPSCWRHQWADEVRALEAELKTERDRLLRMRQEAGIQKDRAEKAEAREAHFKICPPNEGGPSQARDGGKGGGSRSEIPGAREQLRQGADAKEFSAASGTVPRLDPERILARVKSHLTDARRNEDPLGYLAAVVQHVHEEQGLPEPSDDEAREIVRALAHREPAVERVLDKVVA